MQREYGILGIGASLLLVLALGVRAALGEELPKDLPRLKGFQSHRASSWDTTGGNRDCWWIPGGESKDILSIEGAGCMYRWHLSDPIAFQKSLRVSIEHGHANEFTLVPYQSVAYWYQVEPHVYWEPYAPSDKDLSEALPSAQALSRTPAPGRAK